MISNKNCLLLWFIVSIGILGLWTVESSAITHRPVCNLKVPPWHVKEKNLPESCRHVAKDLYAVLRFTIPKFDSQYLTVFYPIRDLGCVKHYDNKLAWTKVTGVWAFYSEPDYNTYRPGAVLLLHGIDFDLRFYSYYAQLTSSLRPVGNRYNWNENSITLFTGPYFTGLDRYIYNADRHLGTLHARANSAITTGEIPWLIKFYWAYVERTTFCCLYPNTRDYSPYQGRYDTLSSGIYEYLPYALMDSIVGVTPGCPRYPPGSDGPRLRGLGRGRGIPDCNYLYYYDYYYLFGAPGDKIFRGETDEEPPQVEKPVQPGTTQESNGGSSSKDGVGGTTSRRIFENIGEYNAAVLNVDTLQV